MNPFFHQLVDALDEQMGEAYPELHNAREHVKRVLKVEEERFAETIEQGMRILDEAIGELDGKVIPGHVVFKLYDTFGFPFDLTQLLARERDLRIALHRQLAQLSHRLDEGRVHHARHDRRLLL